MYLILCTSLQCAVSQLSVCKNANSVLYYKKNNGQRWAYQYRYEVRQKFDRLVPRYKAKKVENSGLYDALFLCQMLPMGKSRRRNV